MSGLQGYSSFWSLVFTIGHVTSPTILSLYHNFTLPSLLAVHKKVCSGMGSVHVLPWFTLLGSSGLISTSTFQHCILTDYLYFFFVDAGEEDGTVSANVAQSLHADSKLLVVVKVHTLVCDLIHNVML